MSTQRALALPPAPHYGPCTLGLEPELAGRCLSRPEPPRQLCPFCIDAGSRTHTHAHRHELEPGRHSPSTCPGPGPKVRLLH